MVEDPDEVRTMTLQKGQEDHRQQDSKKIGQAIAQLMLGNSQLPSSVSEKLNAFLHEFPDVISTGDDDLGRTTLAQHRIDTGDAAPIRQPLRRLAPCQRKDVQKLVSDILKRGVTESAQTPWSSPIVLAQKEGWLNKILC